MKRRPRKIITRAIVFLIAGAIVNVAVAWGQEYRATDASRFSAILKYRVNPMPMHVERTDEAFRPQQEELPPRMGGWPLRSLLRTGIQMPGAVGPMQPVEAGIDASQFATRDHGPLILPVLPLWPGFATNTTFYAAILWLLFAAPGIIRNRRRIRRGLCPACAYPIGTSDICTECGQRVKDAST